MTNLSQVLDFFDHNQPRYLGELREFLAIPSISTQPTHQIDMHHAAEWIANQLSGIGFSYVEIIPTPGAAVVYGEYLKIPDRPTLLIYGHYDVQPPEPLDEWLTPPFEPTVRGDNLYARGVSDMKGQIHAIVKALEAWVTCEDLPLNIKIMIEGEEELGSPNLAAFIADYQEKLHADLVLNADTLLQGPQAPSIVYGLRGLAYFEVEILGPSHDLHSGMFGGSILNPAQALCQVLAGMHDADGRITLSGFYNKVREVSLREKTELEQLGHSDTQWRELTGVPELVGEKGFTTLERLGTRPTLEINGLMSGFMGEGIKTILPARAKAKISMRLVPHQDPEEVYQQLRNYVQEHTPTGVTWEVRSMAQVAPVLVDRDSIGMRAAVRAIQATFNLQPVFRLEGGSVPVVSIVQSQLGLDCIQMGFGLPDDNFHAPNEKLYLPNYYRAIQTYIRFFENLAQSTQAVIK